MLGYIRTSDTSQTGPRCPCTPHPAFYPRTSWLRRVQIVWPQWSFQPWLPLWLRSLCPVRALCYYLDRTSDRRQNKELVFVSFKKGFDKDISPATISSWIKPTVILCYELSDQEALTLHHVKAHDVFAASKAFQWQSGVSLEQILSACHWKSHNTFTQFYLNCDFLPLGSLFLMGLNSILSSYSQSRERSEKRDGATLVDFRVTG